MKITVVGCGRWGTLIAWYLDGLGNEVTLYGRAESANMRRLLDTRKNEFLKLPDTLALSVSTESLCHADVVIISIPAQGLSGFLKEIAPLELKDKIFVLCMKGIEIGTGKRLSEIAEENLHPSNSVAIWVGPGHVQEFYAGVPNCMVIDSKNDEVKRRLVDSFSSDLIRFYYGSDLIGNEVGAASKLSLIHI